jgi:5-methylcytosine-specific restriction endonuclease McrA
MYKACSRCGRIHDINHRCSKNRTVKDTKAFRFRQTAEWHNKREDICIQDKYICLECRDKGIYNYNQIEVHHIVSIEQDYELRLEDSNLISLCNMHHREAERNKISKDHLYNLISKYRR